MMSGWWKDIVYLKDCLTATNSQFTKALSTYDFVILYIKTFVV